MTGYIPLFYMDVIIHTCPNIQIMIQIARHCVNYIDEAPIRSSGFGDHSVYAPSQWETAFRRYAISPWLSSYPKWSLVFALSINIISQWTLHNFSTGTIDRKCCFGATENRKTYIKNCPLGGKKCWYIWWSTRLMVPSLNRNAFCNYDHLWGESYDHHWIHLTRAMQCRTLVFKFKLMVSLPTHTCFTRPQWVKFKFKFARV